MTRLVLTLPEGWTPTLAREQMERYERLMTQYDAAVKARDGKQQLDLEDQLRDIADELIEAAVLSGAWKVEAG